MSGARSGTARGSWHRERRRPQASILHLVDEDRDAHTDVGGQAGHIGEELQQVDLRVTGVGPSGAGAVDGWRPALNELAATPS